MDVKAWARTDVGKVRDNNEDRFLCDQSRGIFAVADGIGGKPGGEVASQIIVDALGKRAEEIRRAIDARSKPFSESGRDEILDRLATALQEINQRVYQLRETERYPQGVGSTVDLVVLGGGGAFILHVGDSRVYLLRDDEVFRVTRDHTFSEKLREDTKLRRRYLNPERYAHILTRSIGGAPVVEIDRFFIGLRPGDRLVLCSDGVSNYLSGAEILEFSKVHDDEDLPLRLIACANERGGHDNATAVAVAIPLGEDTGFYRADTRRDTVRSVRILQSVDLFSELDFQELLTVLQHVDVEHRSAGELIIARGDAVDGLYVVMRGELKAQLEGVELSTIESGQHFGEFALFGEPLRSADVRCVEDCELLFLSGESLQEIVGADAALGNKLLTVLLARTSQIIQSMLARQD